MRWRKLLLGVYLALQVLVPLEYYLHRQDRHDERFAWRMFSPERMVRCRVTFEVAGEPVALRRTFHEAWLGLAARGRLEVVDGMAEWLCREAAGETVSVDLVCLELGSEEPRHLLSSDDACATGGDHDR